MHPLETLIKEEFNKIVNGPHYSVKYDIKCIIHTPLEDIEALFVMDFSLLRDFINNFSDVLTITPVFGAGTGVHQILPFGDKLEATVQLKPLANIPDYARSEAEKIKEYRFKAILFDDAIEMIESNTSSDGKKSQKDLEDITALKIQLVNPIQLKLRDMTYGTVIRDVDPMTAIRYILTKFSKMPGSDRHNRVRGVNFAPGVSRTVRDHIKIPHLTPVIRIPMVIDRIVGGIYPTGFQYYLQQDMWFLFSPYNTKAFEASESTLTVINVTKDKLAQAEKSFRLTPTQVILLSTGEVKFQRHSFKKDINESMGTRYVDAGRVMNEFGVTGGNKFIVNRGANVNEYTTSSQAQTSAKESNVKITSKHNLERSQLAFRNGAILQAIWENSVDDLLYPGMPVRFIYMVRNEPKQVYGCLCAVDSSYVSESTSFMQRKFMNRSVLSFFVEDKIENEDMM